MENQMKINDMFETIDEVMAYLEKNRENIDNSDNGEVAKYVLPVFASAVTDDPQNMVKVYRWLDLETDTNLGYVARNNIWKLKETDLNLYKFKILCEYRGPVNEQEFLDETVRKKPQDEYVVEAAKHKDFPQDGKDIMFSIHNDVDYLSQEAQEMFIF